MDPASRPAPTTVFPAVAEGVAAFRRRVAIGVFVGGFADAVGVLALAGAAVVVGARLFGWVASPSWPWLAALVPAAAFGAYRVARRGLDDAGAAHHLDRRVGLASLLASSTEADAGAWRAEIDEGASRAHDVLPRVRAGRPLVRALVPVALLLATGLLPPPAVAYRAPPNPVFREALARFEKALDLVEKERILEPEPVKEVRERVADLEKRTESGERAPWSDLDALAERLARATEEKTQALDHLRAEAAALAAGKPGSDPTKSPEERLAAAVNQALAEGLAARIDPELAKALGLDKAGATLDPAALAGLDASRMAELAKSLSGAASDRLAELAAAGLLGEKGDTLAALLEGDPMANPFKDGDKICEDCQGGG